MSDGGATGAVMGGSQLVDDSLRAVMASFADRSEVEISRLTPDLVSRFFDGSLDQTLHARGQLQRLVKWCPPAPLVRALVVGKGQGVFDLKDVVRALPNLCSLSISEPEELSQLAALAAARSLRSLRLGVASCSNGDLMDLGGIAGLTRLSLNRAAEMTPRVFKSISQLPALQLFELSGIPALSMGSGLAELRNTASLRWLGLRDIADVSDSAMLDVAQITQLRAVSLRRLFNQSSSRGPLPVPLARLPKLTYLHLGAGCGKETPEVDPSHWYPCHFRQEAWPESVRVLSVSDFFCGDVPSDETQVDEFDVQPCHDIGPWVPQGNAGAAPLRQLRVASKIAWDDLWICQESTELRVLDLANTEFPATIAPSLFAMLLKQENLESLALRPGAFTGSLAGVGACALPAQLRHLHLEGVEGLCDAQGVEDLSKLERLEQLNLGSLGLSLDEVKQLLDLLVTRRQLHKLKLGPLLQSEASVEERMQERRLVLEELEKLRGIQSLDLSDYQFSRGDLEKLIQQFGDRLIWESVAVRTRRGDLAETWDLPVREELWRRICEEEVPSLGGGAAAAAAASKSP